MPLRASVLAGCAGMLLSALLTAQPGRAVCEVAANSDMCAGPPFSDAVADVVVRRVHHLLEAGSPKPGALMSSPILDIDLRPVWSFALWWGGELNRTVNAAGTLRAGAQKSAAEAAL